VKFDVTMTEDEAMREAGNRLRLLRLSRNITQSELAARAGVSKRSLERLENGCGSLRLGLFFAVCGALGLISGFEMALPELKRFPQDVLENWTPPQRARKRKKLAVKWGDGK